MYSKLNSSGLTVITDNCTVMDYGQWTEQSDCTVRHCPPCPPASLFGEEIKKILVRKLPICPFFEHSFFEIGMLAFPSVTDFLQVFSRNCLILADSAVNQCLTPEIYKHILYLV